MNDIEDQKMLNIFVASRMKNIVERKTVIDVIHRMKHTPVFIEAEEMRLPDDVMGLMNKMIDRSDRFIAIVDDHLGMGDKRYLGGMTPLVYEIKKFQNKVIRNNWKEKDKMVVFMRVNYEDEPVNRDVYSHLCEIVDKDIIEFFENYDDLAIKSQNKIKIDWRITEWDINKAFKQNPRHLQIDYSGIDKPGSLGEITELLYSQYHLNIVHLAGATSFDKAFVHLTAISLENNANLIAPEEIEKSLREKLEGEIVVQYQEGDGFETTIYFELHVLDVPGVMNVLCKVLLELNINIDNIQLSPTPEYKGESDILLWLSPFEPNKKDATFSHDDIMAQYYRLEARLRNLVGVITLKGHVIKQD